MLGESLRVPFRADDWIGTILVGSVLTLLVGLFVAIWGVVLALSPAVGGALFAIIALPSLVLRGYLIGVVRSSICGESTVESFVRWGALVRDGARSTFISAVYLIPAAVLCGLALGGAIATVVSPDGFEGVIQAITAAVILLGGFGLLLYGVVYLYIRPAARAVFASTGSVRAALCVRRVVRLSITADYISGWLIGMGIIAVGPTLLLPLLAISLVVAVVSPPLAFIGVLSTIFLGIGLVFICRVSAAWATGRGSAAGVAELYSDGRDSVDNARLLQSRPTHPAAESRATEASAAVQTGRTVDVDNEDTDDTDQIASTQPSTALPVQPQSHEGDLSGGAVYPRQSTNGSASHDDSPTNETDETDVADGTTATDKTDTTAHETESTERVDTAETDFVWGPTEKEEEEETTPKRKDC